MIHTLKIKKLHKDSIVPKEPKPGDTGIDLYSIEDCTIKPWTRAKIKTGIATEFQEGLDAQIRPRSGLFANFGIMAALGTLDSSYRNEVCVVLFNLSDDSYYVKQGDRIGQLVVVEHVQLKIEEVEDLSTSDRGLHGFGSSGK